ncbi:MAG: aminotransferase class V-fold PLP-dependent enzyme [Pyrinomonadaceae bacterium]
MEELKKRILELETISKDLDPPETVRNGYNRRIMQYADDYLGHLERSKAFSGEKVWAERFAIDGEASPIGELIDIFSEEVAEKGIRPSSGGHLGFIPGGGIYASALADFLVDITNEYAGIYFSSPGAVEMEHELLKWLKAIFRFPDHAVGNLTSGGSIATLIAFTAARDRHQIKSERIPKSVIYLSSQVHHCVNKAIRIIGLEDVIIRHIKLDANSRIDAREFGEQVDSDQRAGLNPFMVVASAGTTDTGAVDPLEEIGKTARENGLWYHIDAAYGGFFILTGEKKHLFSGIEMADSLVVDPHKGLFMPFGIGAVLVKDREAVFRSHHYTANYMQDSVDPNAPVNPSDVSPELTKHFRALRMWLPLKLHGIKPFAACLEEKLFLTQYFRKRLVEIGFETGPEPDLSVSYFWFPSRGVDQDLFNERLMKSIHRDGRVFLSSTKINGKFVIRMAILSFRTKLRTIDLAIEMINEARIEVEKELAAERYS